jgi:ectoine hydroxylase-related dioxygenase (phytanoyl-CoA dioxygenase family)
VLAFHGNVWHGAFPRLTPGLRLSVSCHYVGPHYRLQENFQGRISEEMLARMFFFMLFALLRDFNK